MRRPGALTDEVQAASELENRLAYRFRDHSILQQALTHRSFTHEDPAHPAHNERLEFLGDSVLELVISTALLEAFPEIGEGPLSKLRASLVNARHLGQLAEKLGIERVLRFGQSVTRDVHRSKSDALVADALEAILGAIYLDGGLAAVDRVIRLLFAESLSQVLESQEELIRDFKTPLQEYTMRLFGEWPTYYQIEADGPHHDRRFKCEVALQGRLLAVSAGRSKKEASQRAAQKAFELLETEAAARTTGTGEES